MIVGTVAAVLLINGIAASTPMAFATVGTDDQASRAEQKGAEQKAVPEQVPQVDRLIGRVVDGDEKPFAGAEVTLESYGDEPQPVATADAEGRFELRVAPGIWKYRTIAARGNKGKFIGTRQLPGEESALEKLELKITLAPAREIQVHVVDENGRPIADALAGVIAGYRDAGAAATTAEGNATLLIPAGVEIQQVYAVKSGRGLDYRSFELSREARSDRRAKKPEFPNEGVTLTLDGARPIQVTLSTTDDQPIPGSKAYVWLLQKPGETGELNLSNLTRRSPFMLQANERGRITFDWIPRWQEQQMTIWPQARGFTHERGSYDPKSGTGEVTLRLDRLVPIRGKVLTPGGDPAAGISIDVAGAGFNHDDFRQSIKSREDGTFEVLAAPNKVYLLIVKDPKWAALPVTGFALRPDQPVENLEFQLRPATRIYGRVTIGSDEKPVVGLRISSYQFGADAHNQKDLALPNPEKDNRWVQPMLFHNAMTDAEGRFEFFVGPGKFDIRGPNQSKVEKYEIQDEPEKEFNFHMPRPEKGILKGLVVAGEPPKPVVGAIVHGIERWHFGGDLQAVTDDTGRFEMERNLHPATIYVTNEDGSLAGLAEIDSDARLMIVPLKPTATATGILFDEATDAPLADQEIVFGINVHMGDKNAPFRTAFGGTVRTDAEGKFQLKRLVQGGEFRINRTVVPGRSWSQVATVTPDKAGEIDLGTVVVEPRRDEKPPTLAERIAQAFVHKQTPVERLAAALPDARLARQRILMLVAGPEVEATTRFMTLRLENKAVRSAFDNFRFIAVSSAHGFSDDAKLLVEKFQRDLQEGRSTFFVIVADADGNLVDTAETGDLMQDGEISQEKLLGFLKKHAPTPLNALTLYDEALAQAKRENKRVIFQETATWCGPCWMLSRFLDKHRSDWEEDYLWVKMDHRWTGAQDLMRDLRGDAEAGVPWWIIVDADGKKLATSNMPSGENIGFPSSAEEIKHFQTMLEQTAQRLSAEQIRSLAKDLQKPK